MGKRLSFPIYAEDHASKEFIKVAASVQLLKKSMSDLNQESVSLARITIAPSLVPMLAAAASKATALGTALGVAAGAGSIFGAAVLGQVKAMEKQQTAITTTQKHLATLTKGTADYAKYAKILATQQRTFNQQFGVAAKGVDNLKTSWQKFLGATRPQSQLAIGKTANLLADTLPKLVPVANAAGNAVNGLLTDLDHWSQGPGFAHLLDILRTSGPKDITAFGHAVGNTITGLGGILQHFVGPGNQAATSLEHLTGAFSKWANSQAGAHAVQGFLSYAASNGPAIKSVFSSLGKIMPPLAVALGNVSHVDLKIVASGLEVISKIPADKLTLIAEGITAVAVATKGLKIVGSVATIGKGLAAMVAGGAAKGEAGAVGTAVGGLAGRGVVPVYVTNKGFGGAGGGLLGDVKKGGILGSGVALSDVAIPAAFVAGVVALTVAAITPSVLLSKASGAKPHFNKINDIPTYNYKGGAQSIGAYARAVSDLDVKQRAAARSAAADSTAARNQTRSINDLSVKEQAAARSAAADTVGVFKAGAAAQIASHQADALARSVKGIPDHKSAKIDTPGLSQANAGVAQLRAQIAMLHGKMITIETVSKHYNTTFDTTVHGQPVNRSPHGATGGIVRRPTMALIGETGPEAVVPLNRTPGNGPLPSGGIGTTVNIYVSGGVVDGANVGKQIRQALLQHKHAIGNRALGFD